jgi:hypothetical protein
MLNKIKMLMHDPIIGLNTIRACKRSKETVPHCGYTNHGEFQVIASNERHSELSCSNRRRQYSQKDLWKRYVKPNGQVDEMKA